mmetsp:Transcript_124678/g.352954  ORF Transcript_124678/g.352954 Transcript_124678/m.352954 type:complete len:350 (-) Transcript_124678:101-1150(-)
MSSPAILGMGNPLLDISAVVTQETFDKYGLKAGDAILAEEKHMPLYAELAAKPDVKYIAGGATQNSIRVAQWMLQRPGMTAFMGCTGDDEYARILEDVCRANGVQAMYVVDKGAPTGKCAVPIFEKERSLITDLKAANNYKAHHLREPKQWKVLGDAKIVYSAGYFATASPECMEIAAREMARRGGTYCTNLSAPFIMSVPSFRAVIEKTLPLCDYLFGNRAEARAYAAAVGWGTSDVETIATRLSLVPPMEPGKPPRTVVITQGDEPTVVAARGTVARYPVIGVDPGLVVDTNGAGDAYVGGFIAGLQKGKDVECCCKAGAYAAAVVIQHYGCTYPPKPDVAIDTLWA